MKIFKYILAQLANIAICYLSTQYLPGFIFQFMFRNNYQDYVSQVNQARGNEELINQLINSSQYHQYVISSFFSFMIVILVLIVIPILISKKSIGEMLVDVDFNNSYTKAKTIILQPVLWLLIANLFPFICVMLGVTNNDIIIKIVEFSCLLISIFAFVLQYKNYMKNINAKEKIQHHHVINQKKKVKKK